MKEDTRTRMQRVNQNEQSNRISQINSKKSLYDAFFSREYMKAENYELNKI